MLALYCMTGLPIAFHALIHVPFPFMTKQLITMRILTPNHNFRFLQTDHCGWGLKADEDIKAGDFLVEYVGEGARLSELPIFG